MGGGGGGGGDTKILDIMSLVHVVVSHIFKK